MTELRRRFPPGVGDISDELIRLVADETGVPFVVIDLDGVVHYASGSVTKLGWEPAAVVGSNIVDYIDGDSHELAAAGMAEFADGLETHEGLPVDFEMCRQDGSRLWVEVGGTPLHARDGRMFVVLRLRHADGKHHLDEFFVALTEADSFEAVLSPLVRSIAAESEGVAAAVHHGFDGRAFAGVVSFGLPPGLLLDPAPWVDAVGSTETLVRTGFATGDGVGPSSTAWLVPVPGAGAITPAVLSLWRAYRGPPLLGHRLQLARNVRHVQLALRRVSEHEQLRYLARHDALTGVANRAAFLARLEEVLEDGEPDVAVAFCDLDGFKAVNDRYGHGVGDGVLIEVAGRLQWALRDGDELARMGGDEFTVLLRGVPESSDPAELAHRLMRSVSDPVPVSVGEIEVGISVGVARATGGAKADEVLSWADAALYESKRQRGERRRGSR